MYKIFYEQEFYSDMIGFSNYLKDYFYKLYTDTGIIDELIILNAYEKSINLLQEKIFNNIERYCDTDLLGRQLISTTKHEEHGYFFIKINSYKMKVMFKLNKVNKEIIIKSLKINT